MTIMPKANYGFNIISLKLWRMLFMELEEIILKSVWKQKRHQFTKTILRKDGDIMCPDIKLYYKAVATKRKRPDRLYSMESQESDTT